MKITVTTSHTVTFRVVYYRQTEGGMDYGEFGKVSNTLEEAINNLMLAKNSGLDEDWIIQCDVNTTTGGK